MSSDRVGPTDEAAGYGLECARVAIEVGHLFEVGNRRTSPARHGARVRKLCACEDPRQRAFSRAVQADDADALTGRDRHVRRAEHSVGTKRSMNALRSNDRHLRGAKPTPCRMHLVQFAREIARGRETNRSGQLTSPARW